MNADLARLFDAYMKTQVQYRSTGDAQFKPAAETAKNALETYIFNLENTVREREAAFQRYINSRAGTNSEVGKLAQATRQIRDNSEKIAADYLVAFDLNQPVPIDWTQYYAKFAILAGLVVAGALAAFVR